jgi:hypothetical protein
MAATVDNRPDSSNPVATEFGKGAILKVDVDFSATGNSLAQNETMALLDIPADTIIEQAYIKVGTAQSGITDVDVGISTDGSTDATLVDGVTLATVGYKSGGTSAVTPQAVGAASQLVLTNKVSTTISTAAITVILVIRDVG